MRLAAAEMLEAEASDRELAKRFRVSSRVRSNLQRSLANLITHDIGQLTVLVKTRLRRMQYQPGLLEGFLAKPRLDLTPLSNPRN